jgi:O-antigen ligase
VVLFSSLFALGLFLIASNKAVMLRFNEIKQSTNDVKLQNNNGLESSKVRLIMWNASCNLWQKNIIFGTGTGDYNDELKMHNIKNGNIGVAREELNSHNQFLNTGVQLGLLGFVILAMIFFSSYLIHPKSLWHISVLIVFLVNFLVESFIETQSGIVLFCVLIILFFSPKKIEIITK